MLKRILAGAGVCSALVILGAGCAGELSPEATNVQPQVEMHAVTSTVNNDTQAGEFSATAEATAAGTVVVKWQRPAIVEPGTIYRVVYGKQQEPTLPGAYWYERSSNQEVSATVPNVPSGTQYFRVCEYREKACVRYTNAVEVNVP